MFISNHGIRSYKSEIFNHPKLFGIKLNDWRLVIKYINRNIKTVKVGSLLDNKEI